MEFSLTKKKRKRNSEVHFMLLCLYVYNLQVAWFYQLLIDERPTNLCLTFVSLHLCTTIIELKASAAPPSRSRSLPMVSACWVMCSWLCARHLCAVSPRLFFCRPAVLKVFRETLVGLLYLLTFSICWDQILRIKLAVNSIWSETSITFVQVWHEQCRSSEIEKVFREATIMLSIKFNGYYNGRKEDGGLLIQQAWRRSARASTRSVSLPTMRSPATLSGEHRHPLGADRRVVLAQLCVQATEGVGLAGQVGCAHSIRMPSPTVSVKWLIMHIHLNKDSENCLIH